MKDLFVVQSWFHGNSVIDEFNSLEDAIAFAEKKAKKRKNPLEVLRFDHIENGKEIFYAVYYTHGKVVDEKNAKIRHIIR